MTAEENKSLVQEYYTAYNVGDLDLAAGFADDDIVVSLIPLHQTFEGIGSFKRYLLMLKKASQDASVKIVNQIATENTVVNEFVFYATQTGPLNATAGVIPATGNVVEFRACDVWEFKNSKIAAIRTYFDSTTLTQQLGLASDQEQQ